jgi:hypothetical protein
MRQKQGERENLKHWQQNLSARESGERKGCSYALPSSMCSRSEEGEGAGGWGRQEEAEGREGVEHRF